MDRQAGFDPPVDLVEERGEVLRRVLGRGLPDHHAGRGVQRGEQIHGAVPLVVVAAPLRGARDHRQHRGGSLQRLDLRLLVDEAHLLCHDQLEAIRMLSNADLDSASPLAIVLTGQPQLRANMKLGVLAALDQRITVRYAMQPMTPEETTAYLRHHTRAAGRSDALFSDDAAAFLHHAARGYPRAVNRLAVAALIATYAARKTIADEAAARAAAAEVSDQ